MCVTGVLISFWPAAGPLIMAHFRMAFLLFVAGVGAVAFAPERCAFPSLLNATQTDLQRGLRLGFFTSVDLVEVNEPPLR